MHTNKTHDETRCEVPSSGHLLGGPRQSEDCGQILREKKIEFNGTLSINAKFATRLVNPWSTAFVGFNPDKNIHDVSQPTTATTT